MTQYFHIPSGHIPFCRPFRESSINGNIARYSVDGRQSEYISCGITCLNIHMAIPYRCSNKEYFFGYCVTDIFRVTPTYRFGDTKYNIFQVEKPGSSTISTATQIHRRSIRSLKCFIHDRTIKEACRVMIKMHN